MSPERKVINLVVLAKNEERTIERVINQSKCLVDEILVIDGHSADHTRELARKAGAKVILDNRKGKGDGIRVGIQNVTGDIIVFIDADGSHDPQDIPKLVKPILDGESDMVIGSRGLGGSGELHGDIVKLLRMIGSDIILILINLRWKQNLTDSQNGFRAIRTDVARSLGLRENITTIEQEMTMKCLKFGYRVSEVASHEYARQYGRSVISLRKVWFRYIWTAIKYAFF